MEIIEDVHPQLIGKDIKEIDAIDYQVTIEQPSLILSESPSHIASI